MSAEKITISSEQVGTTLAAILRQNLSSHSWSQIRRFIQTRHVKINGDLCLDPARRLKEGDTVEILSRPAPKPHDADDIVIRYLDEHVVVVDKPAGIPTVRHPTEREWTAQRRALAPTLDDLVAKKIARTAKDKAPSRPPGGRLGGRLRVVHRLDKETSGLVVFARTVAAERCLGKQFHAHTVIRKYLAIVPGYLPAQKIESTLVRDRGDGRRGSIGVPEQGKKAVTHIDVAEKLPRHTLLSCRLETGRTHQIRIHLAEKGHPVCGEKVYNKQRDGSVLADESGAPRLALHAAELGFVHPVSEKELRWEMPLPKDLQELLNRLRRQAAH